MQSALHANFHLRLLADGNKDVFTNAPFISLLVF